MFKRFFYLLIVISVQLSCEKSNRDGVNSFSDPDIRKIADFKDRRISDSLLVYFTDQSPEHRSEAALAFGSLQDSTTLTKLEKFLIRESDANVRKAIVYSIGQTKSQESERILLAALNREKNPEVIREALEAYGKVTSHWQLVHPSFLEDTVQAEGLAWSIYRAGLNHTADSTANRIAAKLIHEKHNYSTQLAAAHFFARGAENYDRYFDVISKVALNEKSGDIRMAATLSLRKIKTSQSLQTLKKIIDNEEDYRVIVNAVRALGNFEFEETKSVLYKLLYHKKANVAIAASEVIKDKATAENWIELSNLTERVQNWRAQANLYEAALTGTSNASLTDEIKTQYKNSINVFQKAALITALQSHVSNFDFIEQELIKSDTPVIRSAAAAALSAMNFPPALPTSQNGNFDEAMKKRFAELCIQKMPEGDAALISAFAAVLGDSILNYRSVINDFSFLYEARKKLSLPKDFEALQPLEVAIAYFEKRKAPKLTNDFNHPIDWALVATLPKDLTATIKTSRGAIRIRLLVEEAPGSVANFVQLARSNYFDKKPFHRVVPNFVIQGGCNRGDGFGSENYSIRSEFSPRKYTTGSVGMASAGKDTEGTQWFITHSPTPHLDGRYTIFAEVIDGMEAVGFVEVGDQILDVTIDLK
jgi:cyclophilin family peptidyl-prolyl cis-trans isomerase/HEAT repeat protein